MFNKLVMVSFTEAEFSRSVWMEIAGFAGSVVCISRGEASDKSRRYLKALSNADAAILQVGQPADADLMNAAPELRYIGVYGTGYGMVDVKEATRRAITVCNIPDYSTRSVAEFTVAIILADLRELHRAAGAAAAGNFSEATYTGRDLGALTVGIVGAGTIGARVARLVHHAFGSSTIYWSRSTKADLDDEGISYAALETLLSTCDIVTLHVASNTGTQGLLHRERLALLKPGALLVCTVPMDVIEYVPLMSALRAEALRLVFDHADEMTPSDAAELTRLPTVTAYPPVAYTTEDATRRKHRILVESLRAFVAGRPVHTVN